MPKKWRLPQQNSPSQERKAFTSFDPSVSISSEGEEKMSFKMPMINVNDLNLSEGEKEIVEAIISGKGETKGRLRTTKPSRTRFGGDAAYVWRIVCFHVSPIPQHHCLPMCADFDIEVPSELVGASARMEFIRNRAKELNMLVDRIVNSIPVSEWHGTKHWHRAFYG